MATAKSLTPTELQQVLNMDDATKTELIKILDNTTSKSPINLQIALINVSSTVVYSDSNPIYSYLCFSLY